MLKTGMDGHFPYAVWEEYVMRMLSAEECTPLEEHLLVCPACQDLLAEADEYIEIAKTALTRMTHGGSDQPVVKDSRTRRRLSKGAAAASRGY